MADEGVTIEVTRFPEGTRTAADAAAAIGCEVAAIVKSLVFVVDGVGPVLALTSGANRVDTDRLGAHFGGAGPARQAKPDEARAATGYAIGGTPPFGHPAPVPTCATPRSCDSPRCGPRPDPRHGVPAQPRPLGRAQRRRPSSTSPWPNDEPASLEHGRRAQVTPVRFGSAVAGEVGVEVERRDDAVVFGRAPVLRVARPT